MHKKSIYLSAALLGVCVGSNPVFAQPQTSSKDNNQKLQDIVVSADSPYNTTSSNTTLGTDTKIVNTPFSVTSIDDKVLEDQNAHTLSDAVRNTPGVSTTHGEGNRDSLVMRGVRTKSDFFMNGMRDDREYYRPMYNVDRIDILKGPAALEFGRAGAGGIVNYVTKKAQRRDIRQIKLEGGSWNHWLGTFDYNTPVGDKGAFRLMGMGEHSKGYRDYYFRDRAAINPVFYYAPSEDTDINVSLSHLHDRRIADRGIPGKDGKPLRGAEKKFFGDPDGNRAKSEVTAFDFDVNHFVNDSLQLRNKLRISRNDRYYINVYPHHEVGDKVPGEVDYKAYDHPGKRWTYQDRFEGIIDFNTGSIEHTVLTGIELTHQKDHDIEYRPGKSKDVKDNSGNYITRPPSNPTIPLPEMDYLNRDNTVRANEIGLFAQDQVKLNQYWQVLAGMRLDHFRMDGHWTSDDTSANGSVKRNDTTWSPRLALMFKANAHNTSYISFSRTYSPSASNLALSLKTPEAADFKPERADSYEIGHKINLFNEKLLLGAALYQLNIRDTTIKGDNGQIPAGGMRSRGIELYANGQLTQDLAIFANYTYNSAEFTKPVKKGEYKGNRPRLVPRNQASLWATYDITSHWGVGAGVRYESEKFAKYKNEQVLPSYTVGDAMTYYETGPVRYQLNINNITNKKHYYPDAHSANQIMPGEPINFVASVRLRFD